MLTAPISVVIPCFNCMNTIERAIHSIECQTLLPNEVIVVIDGGNDKSLEVLRNLIKKSSLNIKIIDLKLNYGVSNARNLGWEESNNKYIAFLDSDDSWHINKIEFQYEFLTKNPNIDVLGNRTILWMKNMNKYKKSDVRGFRINKYSSLYKTIINSPSIILKKTIPIKFDINIKYAEDQRFIQNILFQDYEVYCLNLELSYIHKPFYGSSGLSKNIYSMEVSEIVNLFYLYKIKKIDSLFLLSAIIFSIFKFTLRLVKTYVKFITRTH